MAQVGVIETVQPARRVAGSVRLPGDKSISHRYAMLGALAEGSSRFENFSSGADCASTLACVQALGVRVRREGSVVHIEGRGPRLSAPAAALDCGNSGSTMRMLAGILAGQDFTSELRGDASLTRRPMARIIAPLTAMGAEVTSAEGERPPLHIFPPTPGARLRSIHYKMPVASAQVKSCVLFAGLLAEGETTVEEPLPTRDHGELALRAFGAEVQRGRNRASIAGGQKLHAIEATIPGDISSAAFFLCAAAALPGSTLIVDDVLLNPTRALLLEVLGAMGAAISVLRVEERNFELVGTVKIQGRGLSGISLKGAQTAVLIDELPVLAAIAPLTRDGITISDARELRVKESDRIAAVAENLRRMGAQVQEREDGLRVPGAQRLRGAEIDSAGDHRIAMAFAVAALAADGESTIQGADAARISYPEFFPTLNSLAER
ncbi:MAG TPA: 3-phosphoshikimate 1-carboxyvinyltransferase [Terriglobales bacterium]|nr:3-phosphoshikimate 1-carboxyvinyltransferase [Terriglobales bacterium]